jgi:hypothetical protein
MRPPCTENQTARDSQLPARRLLPLVTRSAGQENVLLEVAVVARRLKNFPFPAILPGAGAGLAVDV